MRRSVFQAVIACAALLGSSQALAKVEVQAGQHKTLGRILVAKVSEDIVPGDYEALLKGIKANPGKFARKVVMLDSIGGSVSEAMRMGRLLRETGFDSLVPSTGMCQGSCVYLLAAGRNKTVRGHVGIHRPYYSGSDSVHSASGNLSRASQVAYFRDMQVSLELLDAINRTEPPRMRVLSPSELARYRLK
ncbi:hypothetical protein DBR00_00880 [Pseudomonas sp. HMWF032]|uniref:COG3904 family protein n=1 Tax=unclassified Pseudomonas TaxID=196821 RepID=UPI000D34C05D|nr:MULTISPECIES: hypothetical protein [unclassified Pseudomonas]PTS86645.1 hypothetical protein DBR00_00880 [Pseudomonas sp. HMWF032]PTT83903.1 hypothetical protein DBR41_09295 [Pseudomonas sp. HMWF010]WAC44462.1 hypothetical protein OU997_19885 [Pseudomonas sp. SL4(2022)]